MRIGLLCSRVRVEEKQLLAACAASGVSASVVEEAALRFNIDDWHEPDFDVIIERSADPWRAAYAIRLFEAHHQRCINTYAVAETCSNKLLMSVALEEARVAQPRTAVAFDGGKALAAAEEIGYPVLFKPAVGNWEQLLGKANDREAAEAILEHKQVLGTYHHTVSYIQEFIAKPGRDVRLAVVGERVIAAVQRYSEHWSIEAARDVTYHPCALTPAITDIALRAAGAVGGGVLAVDLVEDSVRGYLVVEVGPLREFRHIAATTESDIAGAIVEYAMEVGRGSAGSQFAKSAPSDQTLQVGAS